MARQTVLLVYGGESTESEASVRSARSVFAAMDGEKYEALLCYIDAHGKWWILDHWTDTLDEHGGSQLVAALGSHSFLVLPGNALIKPDVVMPLLGDTDENDRVAGLARLLHMMVVAPASRVSAVTQHIEGLIGPLQRHDIIVDTISDEPDERIVVALAGSYRDPTMSVAATIVDSESPDDRLRSIVDDERASRAVSVARGAYEAAHIRTCALITLSRRSDDVGISSIDVYPDMSSMGTFLKLWRMSTVRYPEVIDLLIATAQK